MPTLYKVHVSFLKLSPNPGANAMTTVLVRVLSLCISERLIDEVRNAQGGKLSKDIKGKIDNQYD